MPFYHGIDPQTGDGQRTITRLQALRTQLDADVPTRTLEETLLLGTWNLREFGAGKHGGRRDESIATIAEIVSRFDVVALQEVNKDLTDLDRLLRAWPVVETPRHGHDRRAPRQQRARRLRLRHAEGHLRRRRRRGRPAPTAGQARRQDVLRARDTALADAGDLRLSHGMDALLARDGPHHLG